MNIRPEILTDVPRIHAINCAAFETPAEAGLVDVLREQARPVISLVAEMHGAVIGHILFSPVTLDTDPALPLMGLAPMAVALEHQHSGIGSALVRAGLAQCRANGAAGVVVLGHPEYYPRFGFVPATGYGLRSEYDAPDEAFMALELMPGAFAGRKGLVRYHPAFARL